MATFSAIYQKHNIHIHDIAFRNYKIKCTRNQTPVLKWLLQTSNYKIMIN